MKNLKLFSILAMVAVPLFSSCLDDDEPEQGSTVVLPYYAYFLNEGSMGRNDGEISGMTYEGDIAPRLYSQNNRKQLGDVANDLIFAPNGYLYVAVSNSNYIAKLDLNCKELARYETTATEGSPRSLAVVNGDLYVTMYGGIVERFDTATLSMKGGIEVESYPEGIAAIDNTIAVCNSGYGSGNTVSLIDAKSNTVKKTVTLPYANPQDIVVYNKKFYCNTTEYDASWNAVSRIIEIDPTSGATKELAKGFYMLPCSGGMVCIEQSIDYYSTPYKVQNNFWLYKADGSINALSDFDDFKTSWIYGMSVDRLTGYIFLMENKMSGSNISNSAVHMVHSGVHEVFDANGTYCSKVVFAQY